MLLALKRFDSETNKVKQSIWPHISISFSFFISLLICLFWIGEMRKKNKIKISRNEMNHFVWNQFSKTFKTKIMMKLVSIKTIRFEIIWWRKLLIGLRETLKNLNQYFHQQKKIDEILKRIINDTNWFTSKWKRLHSIDKIIKYNAMYYRLSLGRKILFQIWFDPIRIDFSLKRKFSNLILSYFEFFSSF